MSVFVGEVVAQRLEFVAALDAALGGGLAEKGAAKAALRKYAKWASPVLAAVPVVGKASRHEYESAAWVEARAAGSGSHAMSAPTRRP